MYEELAKIVVRDALRIDPSDVVIVTTWDHTIDAANAMVVECFRQGADAMMNLWTDEYYYALMSELSAESLGVCSKICQAFTEAETATINMFGPKNPEGLKNVSPSKLAAWVEGERRAHHPRDIERNVRNIGLPLALLTPQRARAYGFDLDAWRKIVDTAMTADLKKIAEKGRIVSSILERGRIVKLTASNGTDLVLELDRRPIHIDDGIIDQADIDKKSLNAQLPAGSVVTSVAETSGNGIVLSDRSLQTMGLNVQGIEWQFKDGKVISMKARENFEPIRKQFDPASGDKDRIGFLQIGLNPSAEYGYLMDHVVEGAVQIGIGNTDFLGGKNNSNFGMAATVSRATVEVDGQAIVKDGKLTAT